MKILLKELHRLIRSGPDHLYKLDYIAQFANEKEVIGLGDIKVYKISWNDETDT